FACTSRTSGSCRWPRWSPPSVCSVSVLRGEATMRAAVQEISSKSFARSSSRKSTKNAWAAYVRNRWPANTLGAIQAEWDLTEGEARGVLYAQASQPTIDKILDHPNG